MSAPRILVSAARGIGDLIRMTPLVRAACRLGAEVDVLVAPDYPDAVSLLEGASEIRRLFHCPSPWSHDRERRLDGLAGTVYDVATFTVWSAALRGLVRARRTLTFDRQEWLREGDAFAFERQARALGWSGAMPEPFACSSGRRFGLPPGTVALHPGCKPDWPWKKWHGFAELAGRLPSVAVVGTPSDLDNHGTYFARPFAWPSHVQDYVGRLSLADTAALIAESSALVSNDSGLMHVGVALGVPTFGIFGITSEQREALPSSCSFPVTKGLPCQAECRKGRWGRRDCEHHLLCLKTLTADDVLEHMGRAMA
jgi:ADP-heptose:LPS heptosyltransferase